jgi:hypothetical protein
VYVCRYAFIYVIAADGLGNIFQGMPYFKDFSRNKKEVY